MLWLAPAAGLAAAVLSLLLIAYGPRLGYDLREPTAEERERLERLLADAGSIDAAYRVRESADGTAIDCDLLGVPGRRILIVADGALADLSDGHLRALLAVEAERSRSLIDVQQAIAAGIGVGVFASVYVTPLPVLEAFLAAWLLVLLAIALARRRYLAVDAAVAERVGHETLRSALEERAASRGESLEPESRLGALLEVEPSLGTRVDRLGDGAPGES